MNQIIKERYNDTSFRVVLLSLFINENIITVRKMYLFVMFYQMFNLILVITNYTLINNISLTF